MTLAHRPFSSARPHSELTLSFETPNARSAACGLLSDEASWVSGETLKVDGAAHTREYPRFFDVFGLRTVATSTATCGSWQRAT
jgi:hypothetical protein